MTKLVEIDRCPKCACGEPLIWYHDPGVSRFVCSKKCNSWKIITGIEKCKPIKDVEKGGLNNV